MLNLIQYYESKEKSKDMKSIIINKSTIKSPSNVKSTSKLERFQNSKELMNITLNSEQIQQ